MKLKDYIIIAIIVCAIVGVAAVVTKEGQPTPLVQGLQTAPQYLTATNSGVSCPSTTSTLVVAGGGSRNNFTATNAATSSVIYLCKGLTCSASTGMTLFQNGGAYEQLVTTDAYNGPYSCIAGLSTSTLTYIVNQ